MPADEAIALRAEHLEDLARRYATVLAEQQLDAVVVHSGRARPRRQFDDQDWPLQPVPHFTHWIPLAEPECLIAIVPGRRPRLVRPIARGYWEAPPKPPLGLDGFEVVEVDDPARAAAQLPGGSSRVAFVGEEWAAVWARFAAERRNPPALLAALDRLRAHKTPYEVACVAAATRVAVAGHQRAAEEFQRSGASELQLHLLYLSATGQDDAETPYKNIFAKGENAATLHHVAYRRRSHDEGSLLVDAGATSLGYASDITRTHARGEGEAADRFRALLAGMEAMQQRTCAEVRVGLPYEELHDRSHFFVAQVMRDVGIGRASVEELVATRITRAFFPHGLGHSLGIQVHDVGCRPVEPKPENPFLRNTSVIAEGQIFTIEPGFYFIRSLLDPVRGGPHAASVDWALVDRLSGYGGIRIEDNVHVAAAGPRNLTREAWR